MFFLDLDLNVLHVVWAVLMYDRMSTWVRKLVRNKKKRELHDRKEFEILSRVQFGEDGVTEAVYIRKPFLKC